MLYVTQGARGRETERERKEREKGRGGVFIPGYPLGQKLWVKYKLKLLGSHV